MRENSLPGLAIVIRVRITSQDEVGGFKLVRVYWVTAAAAGWWTRYLHHSVQICTHHHHKDHPHAGGW
jgi:hypothetical protein